MGEDSIGAPDSTAPDADEAAVSAVGDSDAKSVPDSASAGGERASESPEAADEVHASEEEDVSVPESAQKGAAPQSEAEEATPQVEGEETSSQGETEGAAPQGEGKEAAPQVEGKEAAPQVETEEAAPQGETEGAAPLDPLDPLVIGHYHAKRLLGETDSGRLYEGWDVEGSREVLLCLLEPDAVPVDDIEDRLQHLSRLEHLHILPLLDWNLEPAPHLVYQLEGVSLRRIIDAGSRLSLSQALLIGLQASETLDGLVSEGISHGALRPDNFMVDASGRLRLAGLGIFCLRTPPHLDEQGQSAPDLYAAPETSADPSRADTEVTEVDQTAADVYSLALVLAEAAAGEWVSPRVLSLMGSGQLPAEDEEKTSALGPLAPLFIQAVAFDSRERPTVGEFALALRSTAELLPPPKRFDEIIETLSGDLDLPQPEAETDDEKDKQKAPRRLTVVAAIASSAALVLCAGLLLFFTARGDSTPTYEVPDIVGMSWSKAEDLLQKTGWEPRRLEVRVAESEPEEVTAQLPASGELLDAGQVVKVQVSLGDPLVVVPLDLLGIPLSEARLRLSAIGLQTGRVQSRLDTELAEGTVLEIDEPSSELPRGSQVDLVISTRG